MWWGYLIILLPCCSRLFLIPSSEFPTTMQEFCSVFAHTDLRTLMNCVAVAEGCEQVYNLAADMGGMGFIESNQSVLLFNNTMISECVSSVVAVVVT